MKLVTNKNTLVDILGELVLEYRLLENPFTDAAKDDEGGGDDAAADDKGGDEEEKKDDKKGGGEGALKVFFDPAAVKKYNTNTDWRAGEGEVKGITKKGLEVDVDGNTILVNFSDLTENTTDKPGKEAKLFAERVRKMCNEQDWKVLKEVCGAINESDAPSDEDVEAVMLKIGQELEAAGKIEDAPEKIDADAIKKGEEDGIEQDNKEDTKEGKEPLNEAFGLGVTLMIAAPTLLKLLANIVDQTVGRIGQSKEERKAFAEEGKKLKDARKTGKYDGKPITKEEWKKKWDHHFRSPAAEKIAKLGHTLHSVYIGPLRVMFTAMMKMAMPKTGMVKAWKQSKLPAEIMYSVIMIIVAGGAAIEGMPDLLNAVETVKHAGGLEHVIALVTEALEAGDLTIAGMQDIISGLKGVFAG